MNEREFELLFKQYYSPCMNFAMIYLKDVNRSQDVVQEVFLKLWERKNSLSLDNPGGYLYRAVKNRSIDTLRKNNPTISLDEVNAKNLSEEQKIFDNFVLKERIYNSIRQLPPKCQKVFVMSKINGLTYAQIAEELSISIKTVENHMGKALRILRQLLIEA